MAAETKQALTTTTAEGGAVAPALGKSIQLGTISSIATEGLTDEQIQALKIKHAESMIEVNRKAQTLKVEVGALGAGLDTMAGTVKAASEAGNSATITHSQSNELGRTEAIIGNTETAAKGKLTRSQAGLGDYTLYYIGGAAVVLVILALIFTR